ncbi:bifunctional hydroxymethylpyrimidine kinase/phosphomethylpyrimidine kinase [Anoxynatronum buryatiense]|uniref:Hydroxymethylpyrimidine/phosphomethylpyrimidine kinase n=1 Tax=Anoxynatronum buryatiense TaxID=489973 RepID=A0AA45WWZ7_9CLOT|nr:bifunctional hydroxymethylpyrimidine kinase/phosphomethylpyrimidine kinase [Anoxynatronum buryatiense]SMP61727.1 hydroxymethylpyrimidine/phosphomethylpyrimidine kinase [Anoxynatronum buryatiense]
MKNLLTIAGSDSSGGAGVQADLKTFGALQTYGMSVITAVTAQNTQGVTGVENISPEMVKAQMDAVYADIQVHGTKIGMVSSAAIVEAIEEMLIKWRPVNVVLDPVMVSKSNHRLLQPQAEKALFEKLLPLAALVTPNLPEAEVMIGSSIQTLEEMEAAAQRIFRLGPKAVLVKGGHYTGEAVDILYDGNEMRRITCDRIPGKNTHGTGCTLSSAITVYLSRGDSLEQAVRKAKAYVSEGIRQGLSIGGGVGPLHHYHPFYLPF